MEAEAQAAKAVAEDQRAKAEAAYWMNQRIHEENRVGREQAHRQRIEAEVTAKMSAVQQFDDEAQGRYAEFGPDRFFKQKGTWATIGAAIAQGLGAYAAILGRTENFAGNIIQNAIDRDIAAQREEYLRDKDARNNLVADLARVTGDLDVATEGAKAVQMRITQAHGAELAALSKRPEIASNFKLWNAGFTQKIADQLQSTADRARGNVTIKDTGKIEYPRAGGGGGPPTLKQIAQEETLKTGIAKSRAERRDLQGGGAKETEIAPGIFARDKVEAKEVRTKVSDVDSAIVSLKALQKQTKENPIAARVGSARIPFTSTAVSGQGANIATKKGIATGKLGILSGSGVVNPSEYPRLVKGLETPDGIQGVIDELEISRQGMLKGHSKKPLPPAPVEKKEWPA
jgi:hypothetical protein